jgi:phosphoglycerate dehydrogenase-like enzyme
MSKDGFSRRRFIRDMTVGSTGAALASLPPVLPGAEAAAAEPPFPTTAANYPLAEPGKGGAVDHLKIVTKDAIGEPYLGKIQSLSSGIKVKNCGSEDEFRREVEDAQAIYGGFSRQDLAAAKQLRWIQYPAAGVESILWPELVESPIVLTNMQRIYAPAISESVMGLMLALTRHLPQYALQTREHQWKQVEGLVEISGMTMGIVGMGGIGSETAYRAHYGFHMKVLGVDPKPLPKPAYVAELHSLDWLPNMLPQVDVLVSAAPHTPVSQGMFDKTLFRAMKPTAYFINVSRGKLVDTPALVRALQEGWIAGAGLDVAYKEPLPPDDPLWTAPNLIVTCHTSGWSPKTVDRQMELFSENVRRYLAGLPLLNVVDKSRGY